MGSACLLIVVSLVPHRMSLIRIRRYQKFHSSSRAFIRKKLIAVCAALPVSLRSANSCAVFQKVSGLRPLPSPFFSSTFLTPKVTMASYAARNPRNSSVLPAALSRAITSSLNSRLLLLSSSAMMSHVLVICFFFLVSMRS